MKEDYMDINVLRLTMSETPLKDGAETLKSNMKKIIWSLF